MRSDKDPADIGYSIGNAEEAIDALTRHTRDCVALLDLDGCVRRWNAASEASLGWRADDVLGKKLPHIPDELRLRFISELRAISAADCVIEREIEAVRSDGMRVAMRLAFIPVSDDDGDAFGVLTMGHETALDEAIQDQREEFAALVARRLRDPITAALGAAQLLLRPDIAEDPERRGRAVATVIGGAKMAASIIDGLGVITTGERPLELDLGPLDLAELVNEVIASLPVGNERVIVDFDPAIGMVQGDAKRLQLAVGHLIVMGLRHSPPGSAVSVSVYAREGDATIEVFDSGPVVETSERDRIFDRFYDGDDIRGAAEGGMGLYLVRSVALAHGGNVSLESPEGGGAVFVVRLPLVEHASPPEGSIYGSANGV